MSAFHVDIGAKTGNRTGFVKMDRVNVNDIYIYIYI